MPADRSGEPRDHSRRKALGKLGLGLTAIAGAALLLRNVIPSGDDDPQDQGLPGPDSIFHPRSDHRTGSRDA